MDGAEKNTTNVAVLQPENAEAVVCKTGCNQQENEQNDANAGAAALRMDDTKPKRPRQLTAKALLDKIENLQKSRKSMFNKAGRLRAVIAELMTDRDCENEVKCTFDKYKSVCNEIQNTHDTLLGPLPKEEAEKHIIWYKAKMLGVNDFVNEVNVWLTNTDAAEENEDNVEIQTLVEADARSTHSQSTIGSSASRKTSKSGSNRSSRSGRSSISTKRLQAEAERAALKTRAAALKKKHDLEDQAAQLRRKQEQLELDTEIAASTAKLAVLMNEDGHSAVSNGNHSHSLRLDTKLKDKHQLNPSANQFHPMETDVNERNANDVKAEAPASTNEHGCSTIMESNMGEKCTNQDSKACVPLLQNQDGNLYTLLQKQNQITELLVQQQNSNSLPMREIPIFDGNPLSFQTFMKAFQHCVESKTNNTGDCLYYLHQYTRGQPQELVRSCQHMAPDRGYVRAMEYTSILVVN